MIIALILFIVLLAVLTYNAYHAPEMFYGESERDMWMRVARENEEKRHKEIKSRMDKALTERIEKGVL